MLYPEFASMYTAEAPPVYAPKEAPLFPKLDEESLLVGQAVQQFLCGKTEPWNMFNAASQYAHHTATEYSALNSALAPEALKDLPNHPYFNVLESHLIFASMCNYLDTVAGKLEQDQGMRFAQLGLGYHGEERLIERENLSVQTFKTKKPDLPYKLYSRPFETYEKLSCGHLTEVDSLHIMLEYARRTPGFTFMPAPPRFERSAANASTSTHSVDSARTPKGNNNNVDILGFYHQNKQVVGIQVKTSLSEKDSSRYSDDVVFISGNEDLDNVKSVRKFPYKSEEACVSYPGIISRHRLSVVRLDGLIVSPNIQMYFRQLKLGAQSRTTMATHFRTAYNRIQNRLDRELNVDREDILERFRATRKSQAPVNRKRQKPRRLTRR